MNRELLAFIISQAILAAEKGIAAFVAVNGRPPTIEEWKALGVGWKSPDEIEAGIHAAAAPAPTG